MNLCTCQRPTRNTAAPDRLRCSHCAGYTPYGRTPTPDMLRRAAIHATNRLLHLIDEYRWACEYVPRRPAHVPVSRVGIADPTAHTATDPAMAQIEAWRNIAAHAVAHAIDHADLADAALGQARWVADPGPVDHVRAPYHDTIIPEGRPDLQEAHAARARRRARGDL